MIKTCTVDGCLSSPYQIAVFLAVHRVLLVRVLNDGSLSSIVDCNSVLISSTVLSSLMGFSSIVLSKVDLHCIQRAFVDHCCKVMFDFSRSWALPLFRHLSIDIHSFLWMVEQ